VAHITELKLSFATLAKLDNGKADRLFQYHLQKVAADMAARPGDATVRKVTFELILKPICDADTGDIEGAAVEIECKSKVPIFRTRKYQMKVQQNGLLFNADFPDQPNQPSVLQGLENPNETDDEDEDDDNDGD